MSLNPNDDILAKFKKSNQGYLDNLSYEARKALEELVDLCYPYLPSINAKGEPFEDESVEMTMMLVQQLIIKALKEENLKTENLMEVMRQVISTIDHIDTELQSVRNLINEAITNKKTTEPTSEFNLDSK
ncbi:MAG: hypothetical protein AUH37_03830 [Candidatus Nitrososphaera sp. 13_1_40CM_48_12]|nr:MAG: hypothetical protein AUH37_03830 [Candidatus Nitrososphaera sp. 13_1_40CM_48_12]OLC24583.1 MAG: hypothetical protein AUH71_02380 [Thaumarchaeota archaeon 13_1_40CM_4_48_7]OLD28056.1 MAG: hypothetical protein AUI62_04880 [Thaumarchaeota archaeon 13_1_40CM_2_39_7]